MIIRRVRPAGANLLGAAGWQNAGITDARCGRPAGQTRAAQTVYAGSPRAIAGTCSVKLFRGNNTHHVVCQNFIWSYLEPVSTSSDWTLFEISLHVSLTLELKT